MATISEYYWSDAGTELHMATVIFQNPKYEYELEWRVNFDVSKYTCWLSCHISEHTYYLEIIQDALNCTDRFLTIPDYFQMYRNNKYDYEVMSIKDCVFNRAFYIYYDGFLKQEEMIFIKEKYKNINVIFRDMTVIQERNRVQTPIAFISHDSNDKDSVARGLAHRLTVLGCPVWYDEYTLKVGDSLRESIEKGIKECKKCIVVISPHFIANSGWTKAEFNSIISKEMVEKNHVILPVWVNVEQKDVYDYSPILVDRVGLKWSDGLDVVAGKLYAALIP